MKFVGITNGDIEDDHTLRDFLKFFVTTLGLKAEELSQFLEGGEGSDDKLSKQSMDTRFKSTIGAK